MDWICSGCGRHFNWGVSECPHCRFQTTVTTSGAQADNTARLAIAAQGVVDSWDVGDYHDDFTQAIFRLRDALQQQAYKESCHENKKIVTQSG